MNRDETILFNLKAPKREKIPGEILDVIDEKFSIKKYFILMEGKTEFNYLNGFKEDFFKNTKKIELELIEPKNNSNNARLLLNESLKLINEKKKNINTNLELEFNLQNITNDDKIIILFDCDKNFDQKGEDSLTHAEYAKLIANENNFEIIFSNYSFEVWILCHFKKPSIPSKITGLIKQIKSESAWTKYKKNDVEIFNKLKDKLDIAIKNSNSLIAEKKLDVFSKESNPVTQMGILIESMRKNI